MPAEQTLERAAPPPAPSRPVGPDAGQRRALIVLGALTALAVVAFLTVDVQGSWDYALRLRGRKLVAMLFVGHAIAYSTVLFQTVTNNRILTPSIMGFDALYVLIQSVSVYVLGSIAVFQLPLELRFVVEATVMVAFAGALYRLLFRRHARDLYVLVLAGVVFGALFNSVSSLVNRMIDPNEFVVLQDLLFASFNSVDTGLLVVAALVIAAATLHGWRLSDRLDVVALGPDQAANLGVERRQVVARVLVVVAVLVSVSTALVGPITFFGLLVANLARQLTGSFRHRIVIPAASLLGMVSLVGGQLVLERVFGLDTALSIIINFVGGVYFIALLLREARR